jgi:hypothetical protein
MELIENGGFETGDITGWSLQLPGAANAGVAAIYPASGTYAMLYHGGNANSSGSILTQTFAPTAGGTYRLAFDLGGYGAPAEEVVHVSVKGGSEVLSVQAGTLPWSTYSGAYTHHEFTFIADAPLMTLEFTDITLFDDEMDGLLDNVSITATAVPEPGATLLAVGAMLGGFAFWRRSRGAQAG